MMRHTHHILRIALILILGLSLAACRQSQQTPQSETPITIDLQIEPDPPITGESTLLIALTDQTGQPIQDAMIDVRGDMTHAGMQPVSAVAEDESPNGLYRVPFEWTMSGDWVLTISVILPNGKTHKQTFDLTVANP